MNDFLRSYGMEFITFLSGAIVLVALIVCVTIGTMNSNQHYYDAMKHCIDALGIWVPSNNTGLCLTNNTQITQ